mgnify:FL=1
MAGYIRQSTYTDGDVIQASDSNVEYDALVDAFSSSTGHAHDGTSNEGPVIGLIGDAGLTTPLNKIVVDTTGDSIGFFIDVASVSTNQINVEDGIIVPTTTNDIDLGTTSLLFKDSYFSGTVQTVSLETSNIKANDGTSAMTIADGTGVVTLPSAVFTTVDINGGTIDGTTIGSTTPSAVTTSSLVATTADINAGNIDNTVIGATTPAAATVTSLVATTADINGGTIDGTTIGATTPAAVSTTSLVATTADINAGTIDNTVIGGTTPAAGNFTDITATGDFTTTGDIDGRDIAADGTKLDTIETNADVTDTANVTSAGALMDSELTDIAAIKGLDQGVATTDTPTFAGIITSGNVDGRDVSADGTKLDTVETNADVTDTTNVTAAGALMDSELTDIAAVKALDQGVATTDDVTFNTIDVTDAETTRTNIDVDQAGTALALAIALG